MNNPKIQNDIEKMKADYNRVSLSFAEKEDLKAAIFEKINTVPIPVKSQFFNWSFYTKASSLAFATLILVTSPVVVAAQKSLPGEFLYPVKTKVNENVVEVFIPQEEKEQYHKTLLTKRAFEVKTLAETGDLKTEQIKDVEVAIENSVAEVLEISESEPKTEEEIIQNHQEVVAVLEFTEKIIESKNEVLDTTISELKLNTETSLNSHIEDIKNSNNGSEDSVKELIEDAKEDIAEIPEEDKKEFSDEVEKIEKTESEPEDSAVNGTEIKTAVDLMSFSARSTGSVSVIEETDTEDKLNMVLELHEQIAEKRIMLEIEKLEKSDNMSF
jgi:hypothetical protein